MSNAWYPDAQILVAGGSGTYASTTLPPRGVLHTTETKQSTGFLYGLENPYHFQVLDNGGGNVEVLQQYAIDRSARSLLNLPGGVETNRVALPTVQISIIGYSKDSADWSEDLQWELAYLMEWLADEWGIPLVSTGLPWAGSASTIEKMSPSEWENFSGWCGHQHVPENTHWDPGSAPVAEILRKAKTLATYRGVLNVPERQWARDVVDWNIDESGAINPNDDTVDDWNKNMTDGRLWTSLYRMRSRLVKH